VLEHSSPVRKAPRRVVIIGAGGFVGGAIGDRLAADKVPMLAPTRNELDLLKPEASITLQRSLRADDSVVFVSALAQRATMRCSSITCAWQRPYALRSPPSRSSAVSFRRSMVRV